MDVCQAGPSILDWLSLQIIVVFLLPAALSRNQFFASDTSILKWSGAHLVKQGHCSLLTGRNVWFIWSSPSCSSENTQASPHRDLFNFFCYFVGTQVSSHCHDYPGWKGLQGVMWKSMWTFPRWLDLRQWCALMHGIGEKQLNNHTFWGSGICENNCYDLSWSLWTWCGIWAAPSILSECSFLAGRYSAHCPRWHELSKRKCKAWVLSPGNWCKYTSMVKQQTVIELLQYHLCLPSKFRDFLPIWAVSPGKGMEDVRRRRRRCDMLCTLAHLFGPVR